MITVYIASPYSMGNVTDNIRKHLAAAHALTSKGFLPFAPLLFHFQDLMFPRSYREWLNIDLEWVQKCDCLLRLPGESPGADIEVDCAKELDIPVFHSIGEIQNYYKKLEG